MRYGISFIMIIFGLLLTSFEAKAQDTIKKKQSQPVQKKFSQKAVELKESLDSNDEAKIAKSYEDLAQGFSQKGNVVKAEEYYKKALTTYTKLKRKDDVARVVRNLAKVQESQKKFEEATSNYKMASEQTSDKDLEKVNANDVKRLSNSSTSESKNNYLDSNIKILEKENKKDELTDAYEKKAEASKAEANPKEAIMNYNRALDFTETKSPKAINIKNKIAEIYVAENDFDKALDINQKLLQEAETNNDFTTQIIQQQKLATIYFKKNEPEKAVDELKRAYALASEKGNTAEVKKSLIALVNYYKQQGNDKESLAIYSDFLQNFDRIIESDTTLIDSKIFQVTEDKIEQLEKEKALKDELIEKKNTFNFFLIGAVILLLVFFSLIVKAFYAIKKKNKKIALQSLRREMNPHFIFNSLNSVNQFISQNKELEANKYLTNYSQLMRNIMVNSNNDFVTLSNEIEQLQKYLDLEHLRFHDKFDYKIVVDETLDTDTVFVPNMIIQPHLENAIWHGLRYKKDKGLLLLTVKPDKNGIVITVDDDGIGLAQSNELKTDNQKMHQSRGVNNTKERIALLKELYQKDIQFSLKEKEKPLTGTIVTIEFPFIYKMP
ncbi:tetratricopeptide repeat-containing sensor histidine kinase [Flavobacterium terrisoli]|uniref:tetratricopeptide repeat-containing sensor histidine kinase n=1 Tax=Flavobacterium terrisoli TaxID=3242195 RepID=UPI002543C4F4|nr:tetratricopeptide repeat protein [Flavobacterium buctense]